MLHHLFQQDSVALCKGQVPLTVLPHQGLVLHQLECHHHHPVGLEWFLLQVGHHLDSRHRDPQGIPPRMGGGDKSYFGNDVRSAEYNGGENLKSLGFDVSYVYYICIGLLVMYLIFLPCLFPLWFIFFFLSWFLFSGLFWGFPA